MISLALSLSLSLPLSVHDTHMTRATHEHQLTRDQDLRSLVRRELEDEQRAHREAQTVVKDCKEGVLLLRRDLDRIHVELSSWKARAQELEKQLEERDQANALARAASDERVALAERREGAAAQRARDAETERDSVKAELERAAQARASRPALSPLDSQQLKQAQEALQVL